MSKGFKVALWMFGALMSVLAIFIAGIAIGHRSSSNTTPDASATVQTPPTAPVAPLKKHNYDMRDGLLYGYEKIISAEDRNTGQTAPELVMVYFAGRRGNTLQAHAPNNLGTVIMECELPCEYAKITNHFDNPILRGKEQPSRIKLVPGSIGWAVLTDAVGGQLEQYSRQLNGLPHSVWFEPSIGVTLKPIQATDKTG